MISLKDKMIASAKKNLMNYEKLLSTLKKSNIENKEVRIQECEYAIQKQKNIIVNIQHNISNEI